VGQTLSSSRVLLKRIGMIVKRVAGVTIT
jgi:hypothetical protein